ncbi:MAG: glycosyltransferase family 2 protein [Mariniblastus sp.]
MQRFSLIIPMLGNSRLFDDTLASALRNRPDDCQVVVVHDGTYQDTYGLEDEVDFVSTGQRAQLIRFFNCGLRAATGEFVAFVRPGVELDEGWDESVESAFENEFVASVTPIITLASDVNMMVAAGVTKGAGYCRKIVGTRAKLAPRTIRKAKPMGPTSWAAFYRRSALDQVGMVDELLDPHYFDLDLALSLKSLGFRNEVCSDCIVTVERESLVTRELTVPHGRSAQRSARRHAKSTSALVSVFNFVSEVVTSPIHPWKLRHAIQRIGANRMADIDENFADQVSTQARHNKRAQSLGIRLCDVDSGELNGLANEQVPPVRKAA